MLITSVLYCVESPLNTPSTMHCCLVHVSSKATHQVICLYNLRHQSLSSSSLPWAFLALDLIYSINLSCPPVFQVQSQILGSAFVIYPPSFPYGGFSKVKILS